MPRRALPQSDPARTWARSRREDRDLRIRSVLCASTSPADTSAGSANQSPGCSNPPSGRRPGIPLLRNPREVVSGLHARHRPTPSTAVVAVLDPEERLRASASFARRSTAADGWEFRNALLSQLRRVIPHDLRRRTPVRTAVLLYCREGDERWTEEDGAWMWGLRDACTLHGLRCGAYITLTRGGWQVLGEGRGGRRPTRLPARALRHGRDAATAADAPRRRRRLGRLRRAAAR